MSDILIRWIAIGLGILLVAIVFGVLSSLWPPLGHFFARIARPLIRPFAWISLKARIGRFPIGCLTLLLVVLALCVGLAYVSGGSSIVANAFGRNTAANPNVVTDQQPYVPPTTTTDKYIEAYFRFDAPAIWDLCSDSFKTRLLNSGITRESIQRDLDDLHNQNITWDKPIYVNGHRFDNGISVHFYAVRGTLNGQLAAPLGFALTVNESGRIISALPLPGQ